MMQLISILFAVLWTFEMWPNFRYIITIKNWHMTADVNNINIVSVTVSPLTGCTNFQWADSREIDIISSMTHFARYMYFRSKYHTSGDKADRVVSLGVFVLAKMIGVFFCLHTIQTLNSGTTQTLRKCLFSRVFICSKLSSPQIIRNDRWIKRPQ